MSCSKEHSLIEVVTSPTSTIIMRYLLPCPSVFVARVELRVVLDTNASASGWARFLFRHRGARPSRVKMGQCRMRKKQGAPLEASQRSLCV